MKDSKLLISWKLYYDFCMMVRWSYYKIIIKHKNIDNRFELNTRILLKTFMIKDFALEADENPSSNICSINYNLLKKLHRINIQYAIIIFQDFTSIWTCFIIFCYSVGYMHRMNN